MRISAMLGITVALLIFRIIVATQSQYFPALDYFDIRQVEHIKVEQSAFVQDPLTTLQQHTIIQPYWFIVASIPYDSLFSFKLLANLAALASIPLVFFIGYTITKSTKASILASISVALSPIILRESIVTTSSMFLSLFFLLLCSWSLLQKNKTFQTVALICYIVAYILHPIAVLWIVGIGLFFLISRSEKIPIQKKMQPFWFLGVIFSLWYSLLIYKDAFVAHGVDALYGNVPFILRTQDLLSIDILTNLVSIGFIPLLAGMIVIYRGVYRKKSRSTFVIASICFVTLISGLLTIFTFAQVSVVLSMLLSILVAPLFVFIEKKTQQTKFNIPKNTVFIVSLCILVVSIGVPAVASSLQHVTRLEPIVLNNNFDQPYAVSLHAAHYTQYTGKTVIYTPKFLFTDVELIEQYTRLYDAVLATQVGQAKQYFTQEPIILVSTEPLKSNVSSCVTLLQTQPYVYNITCEVNSEN